MNEDTGVHYMAAWKVGETVLGLGGVGIVTASKNEEFNEGDIVQSLMNWPWITSFTTRTDSPLFPLYKGGDSFVYCAYPYDKIHHNLL